MQTNSFRVYGFSCFDNVTKSDNQENRRNFRKILQNVYIAKWKPEKSTWHHQNITCGIEV